MNEPSQGNWGALTAVSLLTMAIGSIFFAGGPLESTRPVGQAVTGQRSVEEIAIARLWQDPFEAIQFHWNSIVAQMGENKPLPPVTLPQTIKEFASQEAKARHLRLFVMLSGKPYADDIEQRRRMRYAIVTALTDQGYAPKDSGRIGYVIGPRFLTAHEDAMCFQAGSKNSVQGMHAAAKCTLLVGFEHYNNTEPNDSDWELVTVLWLNAQDFERHPLQQVGALMAAFAQFANTKQGNPAGDSVTSVLIGPPTSDQLKRMRPGKKHNQAMHIASRFLHRVSRYWSTEDLLAKGDMIWAPPWRNTEPLPSDAIPLVKSELATLHILSTRSTVPLDMLFESPDYLSNTNAKPPIVDVVVENMLRVASFRSMVARDDRVLNRILEELESRGACRSSKKTLLSVVHEQDTSYGRLFPRTMQKLAKESPFGAKCRFVVERHGYLTGVDGESPLDREGPGELLARQRSEELLAPFAPWFPRRKHMEPAAGNAQLDYLRRLAGEIQRVSDKEDYDHVAIGVFGADVYDKQLVLQAVRAELPQATYFTTDLDVRFDDPDAKRWTRNLIIGTAYGLSIDKQKVPPFRDSYQAATYRAAALTLVSEPPLSQSTKFLKCADGGDGEGCAPNPKVFEMGLRGPIELGGCEDSCGGAARASSQGGDFGWPSKVEHFVFMLLPLAPLLLLMAVAAYMISGKLDQNDSEHRYRAYKFVLWVAAATLILAFALILCGSQPEYEPKQFSRGVSSIPTMVLNATIVAFALSVARILIGRVAQGNRDLENVFQLPKVERTRRVCLGQWKLEALLKDDKRKRRLDNIWLDYLNRLSSQRWVPWTAIRAVTGSTAAFLVVCHAPKPLVTRGVYIVADVLEATMLLAVVASICYWSYVMNLERWLIRSIAWNWVEDQGENGKFAGQKRSAMELLIERTKMATPILVLPFLFIPLLMLARSTVFEGWVWSWHWLLMLAVLAGYLLVNVLGYQHEAVGAKREILDQLERRRFADAGSKEHVKRLKVVIAYVKGVREGAFAPWTRHPILQSLALPVAGLTGIWLLDYLFGR